MSCLAFGSVPSLSLAVGKVIRALGVMIPTFGKVKPAFGKAMPTQVLSSLGSDSLLVVSRLTFGKAELTFGKAELTFGKVELTVHGVRSSLSSQLRRGVSPCLLVLAALLECTLDAGGGWAAGFLWVGHWWKWLEFALTKEFGDFVSRDLERREAMVLRLPSFDRAVIVKERPDVDSFLFGCENKAPTRKLIHFRTATVTTGLRCIQNCVSGDPLAVVVFHAELDSGAIRVNEIRAQGLELRLLLGQGLHHVGRNLPFCDETLPLPLDLPPHVVFI